MMQYLSVCSGIEAATAAWHPLGWKPWAFSEIEKFPSAVLAVHYPDVPNLGDMTKFKDWPDATINVLVGGTPCQSYSVAGLRKGLDDPRGDLMLTYVAIARRYRPSWLVWENVPGVLSDDEGRSFGTLLGLLTGTIVEVPKDGWQSAGFVEGYKGAYGVAWRVLDSQFVRVDGFGRAVPQRRRRVFVVGYLGDWRRAAAVLFERESMSGNPAPRRESGQSVAPTIASRPTGGGGLGTDFDLDGGLVPAITGALACNSGPNGHDAGNFHCNQGVDAGYIIPEIANPLTARMHKGVNTTMDEGQTMVAFDCKAGGETGFAIGDVLGPMRGEGRGGGHSAVAFQPRFARNGRGAPDTVASALTGEAGRTGKGDSAQCVAFSVSENSNGFAWESDVNPTLQAKAQCASANQFDGVLSGWAVRRLTPTECERLQAFADVEKTCIIRVCFDHQKTDALAEKKNRKSRLSALTAENGELLRSAQIAAADSSMHHLGSELPAAVDVLINLERSEVQLKIAGRLIEFAKGADELTRFRLPDGVPDFAQLGALLLAAQGRLIIDGKAGLHRSTPHSSAGRNGNEYVILCGQEIEQRAGGAASAIDIASRCFMSTTSDRGLNSENWGLIVETLSCCVVRAIGSFIPKQTWSESSFDVRVTTKTGYTNISWRGKNGAPDGPRYKALGNSMSVNVMRWIGMRIEKVEAIAK